MAGIQTFLDEINKRIQAISSQKNEIKNRKNAQIEIKNILIKKEIINSQINAEDLLKLSNQDFSTIMELMEEQGIDILTASFDLHSRVIGLYNGLKKLNNSISETEQYQNAIAWLEKVAGEISNYINGLTADNQLDSLEPFTEECQKYLSFFQAGELTKPIFDTKSFNVFLDKCGFNGEDAGLIQKEIGQSNWTLVTKTQAKKDEKNKTEELISKYRTVLSKKEEIYANAITMIEQKSKAVGLELKVNDALVQIDLLLEETPELTYKEVQNAVCCILLKQEIKLFDEFLTTESDESFQAEFISSTLNTCEEILQISRKHAPKPKEQIVQDEKMLAKRKEYEDLLSTATNTIDSEIASLKELYPSDRTRHKDLLDKKSSLGVGSKEEEQINLAIVSESIRIIINILQKNTNILENSPSDFFNIYEEQIKNLRELIETHAILKRRIDEKENVIQSEYPLIFLPSGEKGTLLHEYLSDEKIPVRNYISLKQLLLELSQGIFKNSFSVNEQVSSPYSVFRINQDAITLIYLRLPSNAILVVFADQISNILKNSINNTISKYDDVIKNIIEQAKDSEKLKMLIDAQAQVRKDIEDFIEPKEYKKSP